MSEHIAHSSSCGWAIYACISLRVDDPDRVEEDPLSERMVNARLATFQGLWPHEENKGWKCKTQQVRIFASNGV